jgi:hypothetical protein
MKSLGGDNRAIQKRAARIRDALRYAMSLPVCTTVSGIDSMKVLRQNLRIARGFSPMSAHEQRAYELSLVKFAFDGRFELYKTTAEHDGDVGREQHGYPSQARLRCSFALGVQTAQLRDTSRRRRSRKRRSGS